MKTLLASALAAGLGLSMTIAFAQVTPTQSDPAKQSTPKTGTYHGSGDSSFDELDANKDGYLSKEEVMGNPGLAQNFADIDTNGDGRISIEEWKAMGHHMKKSP